MRFVGSKGGGGSFKQTPDNLRSEDTFEAVLGLCAGPIKGPVRGLKSIKVDGTAVENESGELNFIDFVAGYADGDPASFPQRVNLKLGAGASPLPINVGIPNPNKAAGQGSPGPWVVRTLNNTNADFIDIRFIVSQLYKQSKKGIFEDELNLEIQMKPVGKSEWVNPLLQTPPANYNEDGISPGSIKSSVSKVLVARKNYAGDGTPLPGPSLYKVRGKTNSPSVYEIRIGVPNEGAYANTGWDVRVRLLERDDYVDEDSDGERQEKRTVSWESMAAVYSTVLGEHEDWRGLAWLQLYGKASDQLNGIPELEGEYYTKICAVPPNTIFNPDTRQYAAGIWDGSWAYAYTNDPAWVINNAISDSISGLSRVAEGSYLNKWDALEASKWFSELVPNGAGGSHPRYSLNLAINEPQKAEEFIRYLAGAVGALAWDDGNGQWRMKVDKPEVAVDIFTLENVEGEFAYSHTDVDTRYNDIIGRFKNEEMDYREDGVQLFDNPSIAHIGRKPVTIALVGCTNRQEAMRRVKLRLRSTVNESRIVQFVTNRRGRNINQLDTILVADGSLGDQDQRTTGRVVTVAPDRMSVTLRDTLRLEVGVSYNLQFSIPNPGYDPESVGQPSDANWTKPTLVINRTVTNTAGQRGDVKTIYLDEALPADAAEYLVVALSANGLATLPKMYRVMNVVKDDDGERIAISALEVDTGKWAASDAVTVEDTVFQDLRGEVPMPLLVNGNSLLSKYTSPSEYGQNVYLRASWMRPTGRSVSGFRARYRVNGGQWTTGISHTQLTEFELVNPPHGTYEVEICTIDRMGKFSKPLIGTIEVNETSVTAGAIVNQGALATVNAADFATQVTGAEKPEDNATVGAPAGTPVAGRPAEDLVQTLDDTVYSLDQVLVDVSDLQTTYGTTVSADQARQLAEAARDTAIAKATEAGTKASDAAAQVVLATSKALARGLTPNGSFDAGDVDWVKENITWVNDAAWGTGYFGPSGTANANLIGASLVEVSPGRTYRLTARFRPQGPAAMTYFGLRCYGAAGNAIGNIYMGAATGAGFSETWHTVQQDYSGFLYTAPAYQSGTGFVIGTTKVQLLALTNYNGIAGHSTFIGDFFLEDVTESVNAKTQADAAVTSAQAALTYRDAAGTHAQAASEHKVAASTAETGALNAALATLPSDFNQGLKFWRAGFSGAHLDPSAQGWQHVAIDGFNVASVDLVSPFHDLSHRGSIPCVAGRRYRITSKFRARSSLQTVQHFFILLGADGVSNITPPGSAANTVGSTWVTQTSEFLADADFAGIRALHRATGTGVHDVLLVKLEDITESQRAKDQADASATSASTAAVKATEAGTHAAAASSSRVQATLTVANGPTLPSDFSRDGQFFSETWHGTPTGRAASPLTANGSSLQFRDYPPHGRTFYYNGGSYLEFAPVGALKAIAGHTYRARWNIHVHQATNGQSWVGLIGLQTDYFGYFGVRETPEVLPGGVHERSATWTVTQTEINNGLAWIRPRAVINYTGTSNLACDVLYVIIEDITESERAAGNATAASTHASAAQTSSATASNHAAAALTSSQLSARVSQGLFTPNPIFADPSTPQDYANPRVPAQWTFWSNEGGGVMAEQPQYSYPSPFGGRTWHMQRLGTNVGIHSPHFACSAGWVVAEATIQLTSGPLQGAGMYIVFYNSNIEYLGGDYFNFATTKAADGFTGGDYTHIRHFSKLVQAPAGTTRCLVYLMAGWNGFSGFAGNADIIWYRGGLRGASEAEVSAKTAIPALESSVATNSGAITDLKGRNLAYLQQVVNAGSATAFAELRAESSYGAGATSSVSFGAREFHVYNPGDGGWKKALSVEGGILKAHGIITETAQIGDAIITNAKIGSLQVGTEKIANNAVSATAYAYTPGAIALPYNSLTGVQSVSYTSTGAPTIILVSLQVTNVSGFNWTHGVFDITRNGTTIFPQANAIGSQSEPRTLSFMFMDTPPAGPVTYAVRGAHIVHPQASWGPGDATYRFLSTLEMKK